MRKQVHDRLTAIRKATEDESKEHPQRRRSDELLSQSPASIEKDAQRRIISPIDYTYYWANHFSDKAAALYAKGFLDLPEGTSLDDIPQEYKGRRDMVNSMMASLEQEFTDKLRTALDLTGSGLH